MNGMTRREFLSRSLVGVGALASAPFWARGAEAQYALPKSAVDLVPLGKTGIKATFLAMGTGLRGWKRSSEITRMGEEKAVELLRHALKQGIIFMDMADQYGSHPFTRKALEGVPREKVVLLSKIWVRPQEDWMKPSGGAKEEVDRFRQELGVDMIDIVLIHCTMNEKWPEEYKRVRDELSELKQKGVVRAIGCSCHDHGALKAAAEHPWVDVIMARINNVGGKDAKMDGTTEEISETLLKARANGKAVLGMKIYGEGKLTTKPEQMDASLRFVLDKRLVDAMTIGMLKKEEVDDNIARITKALQA